MSWDDQTGPTPSWDLRDRLKDGLQEMEGGTRLALSVAAGLVLFGGLVAVLTVFLELGLDAVLRAFPVFFVGVLLVFAGVVVGGVALLRLLR